MSDGVIANQLSLFGSVQQNGSPSRRRYGDLLTASLNRKGVLDVDVVKGCSAGMRAYPRTGCYGACYAATAARARGFDFSVAVIRTVQSAMQKAAIERAVAVAPYGFFRVGVMGEPSLAWEDVVRTVEWLSVFARPVVVTKHWICATDDQLRRLARVGTVLNTSVSALDTTAQLTHRIAEFRRFVALGGDSVLRVVSCAFNREHSEGSRMALVQDELFRFRPTIDNPLRIPRGHSLVVSRTVRLDVAKDLVTYRTVSLFNPSTYLGHCSRCPDACGLALVKPHYLSLPQQGELPL